MDFSDYEKIVNIESFKNLEEVWDQRASSYYHNILKNPSSIPQKIVNDLSKLQMIEHYSILDIGGGAGFYAKEFINSHAKRVKILDVSSEMLKYAQENVKSDSVSFEKKDWINDDIDEKYDLVFAAMTPVTRLKQSVDKMIAASNRYCAIVQNITLESSIKEFLKLEDKKYDPHNDKDYLKVLFNYLIDLDYRPQIIYYPELSEETISKTKIREIYQDRVNQDKLDELMNDVVTITNHSLTIMVYWQVN